ncbi:MAG: calcium-binding protein, partial [Mucilaginibacter sp.]
MNWTIEAHSFGIVTNLGPASHDFWVIKDSSGAVVAELHGLATDPTTGLPQAVGFGDDQLRFWSTPNTKFNGFINQSRDSVVVYQGTQEDIAARLNAAKNAFAYLDSLHIPYNLFGGISPNSNSAFHAIGEILGLQYVDFSGVWEPGLDRDLQNILNNYAPGHATPQNLGNTDEILVGTGGVDTLHGETGNDYLTGNGGDDVLIGDQGNDSLIGGDGSDGLFGGVGDDLLIGGKGSDALDGGEGFDSYIYYSGDGFDTILDSDGQGSISYGETVLTGGSQYGDVRVHRDANKHLYVDVGQGLLIDGNLLIKDYQPGNLNLTMTGAVAETNPQTTLNIVGDLASLNTGADALGNIKTDPSQAEANREDTLYDSTGNDH